MRLYWAKRDEATAKMRDRYRAKTGKPEREPGLPCGMSSWERVANWAIRYEPLDMDVEA
jgi:hypothetical protein